MKKLMIGIVGLMIVIAAAVGVLKFMNLGPFEKSAAELAAEEAAPVDEGDAKFVTMDPLLVNVFANDAVAGNFQFELKLEVRGDDAQAEARKIQPRLADAYIQDLHSFIPRILARSDTLDLEILQKRLKIVSDQVTGDPLIKAVLIQSVVNTPAR